MHILPQPNHVNMGKIDVDYRNTKNQPKISSSVSSNLIKINPPPPPPPVLTSPAIQSPITPKSNPQTPSQNLITVPLSTTVSTTPNITASINTAALIAASAPPPPPPLKPSLLDEMDEFLKNTEAEMLASNAAQKAKDELLKSKNS